MGSVREWYSRNVIPSEAEGSFLHTGIASYVWQRKRGKLLRKEQERAECKEDFSLRSKWRYGGNGFISRSVQRICLENAIQTTSSRAKPSIFFVGGKTASVWQQGMGNTVSQERWDGASRKRHSEGVMEKRDEKDFSLLEMRVAYPLKSTKIWNCTTFLFTIVIK